MTKSLRRIILSVLIFLFVCSSYAFADDNPYQPIMEDYKAYMYSSTVPSTDSMVNPMIAEYAGTDKKIDMIVYDLVDLNTDGTPELIAATCHKDGTYDILDVFTMDSGKAVRLIGADDDIRLFLTTDGRLMCVEGDSTVLYSLNDNGLVADDSVPDDIESLKLPMFYTHQVQPDTIINMNSWHEYSGTEIRQIGQPFEITVTEREDGTIDYVIPVTITANKVGMEMSMTQNAYLNTNDFPARILVNIDDDQMCILICLSDDGKISIQQSLLDTEIGPQVSV